MVCAQGSEEITAAVNTLRRGGLVAFPTETVYGLGADARNDSALTRLYAVKRRPREHPCIVHVDGVGMATRWSARWGESAQRLAEEFWPGPLTLIVPRHPSVSDGVTGGQPSVGLRAPAHPIARAIIAELGDGVAAPSANRHGAVSPTTAAHVALDLGGDVDMILDGGPCEVGIESTIVDVTGEPRVLRPGAVTVEMISRALAAEVTVPTSATVRVPGSMPAHYAPRAEVRLVGRAEIAEEAERAMRRGRRVVLLGERVEGVPRIGLGSEPEERARRLYAALREVDERGYDLALVVVPSEVGIGRAIADRIRRAAGAERGGVRDE